jgi:hypothetical protein
MSSEARVCLHCSGSIPSIRRIGAIFCSSVCRDKHKKLTMQGGKDLSLTKLSIKAKQKGSVIFHSCIFYGTVDSFSSERCRCRKTVSREKAQLLVSQGQAVDLDSRSGTFTGGPIVQVGKVKRTPRSATLEKTHCERITEKPKRSIKAKEKTLEELKAAVAEDRAERFEEEKLRLEIYGDLTASARRAWIVEVPADEYDAAKCRDWGRPLFTNFKDERTAAGIGVVVDRILGETENADRAA